MKKAYEITEIQLFDYAYKQQINEHGEYKIEYSYSANLIINDDFVVQVHGDEDTATFDGVADSTEVFWNSEENQNKAFDAVDNDELEEALEAEGFENNHGWLEDHAHEIMNPEVTKSWGHQDYETE